MAERWFRPMMASLPPNGAGYEQSFLAEDGASALEGARDAAARRNTRLLQLFEVEPDSGRPIAYIPFASPNRPLPIPQRTATGPVVA